MGTVAWRPVRGICLFGGARLCARWSACVALHTPGCPRARGTARTCGVWPGFVQTFAWGLSVGRLTVLRGVGCGVGTLCAVCLYLCCTRFQRALVYLPPRLGAFGAHRHGPLMATPPPDSATETHSRPCPPSMQPFKLWLQCLVAYLGALPRNGSSPSRLFIPFDVCLCDATVV